MENFYIFSQKQFLINNEKDNFAVNKNCAVKINNATNLIKVKNNCGEFNLNLTNTNASNFYRKWQLNQSFYLEIITTNYDCLLEKFSTKNCEIFIFDNAAKIIYQNKCYFYYYNCSNSSTVIEDDNFVYTFNKTNLLIFNKTNQSFNLLKVKNYQKNNKNIEILCKFPKNINFFIYFSFNLNNNNVLVKKFLKDKINPNIPLQFLVFYLAKNNFEETKKYISKNLNQSDLCNYFQKFDDIVLIENNFYVYNSSTFLPVNFNVINNIVVDVD